MSVLDLHAELCKTLSNSTRLKIIDCLRDKEKTVNALVKEVGVSQSNLSQHLAILRQKGIVTAKRVGKNVFYVLSYPEMIKACDIIRNILLKQLKKNRDLAKNFGGSL